MIRTIYSKLWIVWGLNYFLAVTKYESNSDKAFLIWLCFIVVVAYIGTFYFYEFIVKLKEQELRQFNSNSDFYFGRYKAFLENNYTHEQVYAFLNFSEEMDKFRLRNGVYE